MNWDIFVIIVACIAGLLIVGGIIYFCIKYRTIRHMVLDLVIKAEEQFAGSKRGQEKYQYVLEVISAFVPKWLKIFINESTLDKLIEEAVVKLKEMLAK